MINALEELVRDTYEQLSATHKEFCSCAKCRDDVLTLAMNHARPRYVVGDPLGAAITRVALSQDSAKAEIAVIVYDAMRKVAGRPRNSGSHQRVDPDSPTPPRTQA